MNKAKRILSFVLCLVMVLTLMPFAALAEGENNYTVVVNYVFGDTSSHYGEVAAASWQGSFPAGTNVSQSLTLPAVQGYVFDKVEGSAEAYNAGTGKLDVSVAAISRDTTVTVYYKPGMSDYRINLYRQNANDDQYTLYDTIIKQGATESVVDDSDIGTIDGCVAPAYVQGVTIAADGSTVVDVYYDRDYYFVTFDLAGGINGPNAIYSRFGTPMGDLANPTRTGYTFTGWVDAEGHDPAYYNNTVPAKDVKFTAQWRANGNTANVSIVLWGENANDEDYSYLGSKTVTATVGSSYAASASDIKSIPITDVDSSKVFAQLTHVHGASCGLNCKHTSHDYTCYGASNDRPASKLIDHLYNVQNTWNKQFTIESGYVYTFECEGTGHNEYEGTYLYLNGTWYVIDDDDYEVYDDLGQTPVARYDGVNKDEGNIGSHTFSYSDIVKKYKAIVLGCTHTHNDSCYTCGKAAATPPADCLYYLVANEPVTVLADGTSVVNVYLDRNTFTYKFGDDDDSANTRYGSITAKWGEFIYDDYLAINRNTLIARDKNPDASTEWEYVNWDPNDNYTTTFTFMGKESYNYYYSDWWESTRIYYEVQNLAQTGYDEMFSFATNGGADYTEEELVPITGFTLDRDKSPKVGYGIDDGDIFYYTRNSYSLVLNNGKENVKTYDKVLYEQTLSNVSGLNGYVPAKPDTVPGYYNFAGWYLNPQCTGKQVDLNTMKMPAANLILYAKWTPPTYTITFRDQENGAVFVTKQVVGNEVVGAVNVPADPAGAGRNFIGWYYKDNGIERRFDPATMPAVANLDLYAKWQSNAIVEYTISYEIQGTDTKIADDTTGQALSGSSKTFAAKGGNQLYADYQEGYFPVTKSHTIEFSGDASYTFDYVARDAVPYTVRYVNAANGEPLAEDKVVENNKKAVVTETYKNINGFVPDSVQKTLVVDINDESANVITFYYTADTQHAMVSVNVYVMQGNGYVKLDAYTQEYKAEVGASYTFNADSIYTNEYYTFDHSTFNEGASSDQKAYSGNVTNAGVLINYYYNEKQCTINYVAVGEGTVSRESETTGYISGEIKGSTPTPGYRMKIDGWYTDPDCTTPVSASWIGDGYKLVPARQRQESVTYYAKFVADSLYNRSIVVDYGIPAQFTLDGYSAIESVSLSAPDGVELETGTTKIDMLGGGKQVSTAYATATVSENDLIYTPGKIMKGIDKVYISAKTNLGTYRYASLSFIPATTVYYEDTIGGITYTNGKINGSTVSSDYGAWSVVGSDMSKNAIQSIANELYGYDSAYENCNTYSMGSAHKVSVSAINNPNTKFSQTANPGEWPTASFSFTGTGFDIISVTDTDTGLIKVKVEGEGVTRNIAVNEYYGYTCSKDAEHPYLVYIWEYVNEGWGWHVMHHETASPELNNAIVATKAELDEYIAQFGSTRPEEPEIGDTFVTYENNYIWTVEPDADTLYQIPTMKVDDLPYGNYTVTITPTYSATFDMNSDDHYSFSLDAIRVYGTLQNNAAYVEANEAVPEICNIRSLLLKQNAYQPGKVLNGIAFIDGIADDGTIGDYSAYGPNNEVYLNPGQAIAFAIDKSANVASVQVGFKAIDDEVSVNVNGKESFTTSSATDMYRDITACIGDDGIVTITNNGENIVALTTLKITHSASSVSAAPMVNDGVVLQSKAMVRNVMMARAPVEKAPFVPSVSIDVAEKVTVGDEVTVKVSTSEDVAFITVNGEKVEAHDANFVWTYTATAETEGEMAIEVVAYNADGEAAEAVQTASVTVEAAPVVPDEPEEPVTIVTIIVKVINVVKSFIGRLFGR